MTSSNKVVICRTCNGRGWYEDHAPHCDGDECIECGWSGPETLLVEKIIRR